MTRQESVAFLGKMQALAQQYGELLERCMGEVKDMDESDLAGATQQAGKRSHMLLAEQQQAWQQFIPFDMDKDDCSHAEGSKASQASTDSQDRISRLTAMGGTPALGAGVVLPKLHQQQLLSLSNTESPAAREVHAAQGKPDEHTLCSPQPSVTTPSNSPLWLVELRKRQGNSRPASPPSQ